MSSIYEQALKEAHKAWGAPVGGPITDNPQLCLRQRLISEEVRELDLEFDRLRSRALAGQQPTVEEKAQFLKELTDVLYVVVGTAVAFGLPLDLAFRAVHASNMSKLGTDGKPIRREDGKVLKGPNYKPADLANLVADNG